jgi:hypothetical protein
MRKIQPVISAENTSAHGAISGSLEKSFVLGAQVNSRIRRYTKPRAQE